MSSEDVTRGEDVLRSILVAGVGNAWLHDDGFGGEVARRLEQRELPPGVTVMDAGTGGLDLAYEVMRGYDALVILDVSKQGGEPGTLYVIEPDRNVAASTPDAHRMDIQNVFGYLRMLAGEAPPITIVGCEPESVEPGMGLSTAVANSVDAAAQLVRRLIDHQLAAPAPGDIGGSTWSKQ